MPLLSPSIEQIHKLAHGRSHISPILRDFAKTYDFKTFVETGSQAGNTIEDVVDVFENVYSIEIAEGCYKHCVNKFAGNPKVHLYLGSSGAILGTVLKEALITKALFWLDAHGPPADEGNQVPAELAAIEKYAPKSVVIVDDVTYENGQYIIDRMHKFNLPEFWVGHHVKNMDLAILVPATGPYTLPENLLAYAKL